MAPKIHVLQFGHGGDAVENQRREEEERSPCLGFNSATAVMPWRTPVVSSTMVEWAELQFGHGGDAVENGKARESVDQVFGQLQFGHGGDAVENFPYCQTQSGGL